MYKRTMAEEETMADNGDDDQWLYGDSTLNLDPPGTRVEDVKPTETVGVVEDEVILNREKNTPINPMEQKPKFKIGNNLLMLN